MDIWKNLKTALGYQTNRGGVDSFGVDHSGFSLRDELEYQMARSKREQELIQNYNNQGITENYPQYGTNFWSDSPENNYGFGTSNISQNVQNVVARLKNGGLSNRSGQNNTQQLKMPTGATQQITMPSYEIQQQLQQPQTSSWDKAKNAANNFVGGTEAFSVGYATGATLGNFDEGMGAATAAVTFNPNNYTMGRDATRQLQNDLQQQHQWAYGAGEFTGAMMTVN